MHSKLTVLNSSSQKEIQHTIIHNTLSLFHKIRSRKFYLFHREINNRKHAIQLGYQRFRQRRGILIEFLLLQHRRVWFPNPLRKWISKMHLPNSILPLPFLPQLSSWLGFVERLRFCVTARCNGNYHCTVLPITEFLRHGHRHPFDKALPWIVKGSFGLYLCSPLRRDIVIELWAGNIYAVSKEHRRLMKWLDKRGSWEPVQLGYSRLV